MDSTININLVQKDEIKVFYETEAHIDNKASVLFIKSGEVEIQKYVDEVSKPEIDNYIETEAKPIVSEVVVQIAEPTINEYLTNTTKPEIDEYVDDLKPDLQAYVTQAQGYADNSQTSAVSSAASAANALASANNASQSATSAGEYASNAQSSAESAASSLNTLTTTATDSFNANAAEKQDQVDASAQLASENATLSQSWAVGEISTRPEGSSKYWAEQASSTLSNKANTDLSNVTSVVQSFINTSVGWAMPDYSAGVSLSAYTSSSNQFTAPSAGVVIWYAPQTETAYINNKAVNSTSGSSVAFEVFIPLSEGDKFYATQYYQTVGLTNKFYPLKGVV